MKFKMLAILAGIAVSTGISNSVFAAYAAAGCINGPGSGLFGTLYACTLRINSYWPDGHSGLSFTGIRHVSCKNNNNHLSIVQRGYDDPDPKMDKTDIKPDFKFSTTYFNGYLPKLGLIDYTDVDKNPFLFTGDTSTCNTFVAFAITSKTETLSTISFCYKNKGSFLAQNFLGVESQADKGYIPGRDLYLAYSPYSGDPVITLAVPQAANDANNFGWVIGVYNGPDGLDPKELSAGYKSNYVKITDPNPNYPQSIWMDSNLFECPTSDPASCFKPVEDPNRCAPDPS